MIYLTRRNSGIVRNVSQMHMYVQCAMACHVLCEIPSHHRAKKNYENEAEEK